MRLLILLAMCAATDGAQDPNAIQLLTTGEHHGHEVPANAAGPWLAMVGDASGTSLERVRVSVVSVKDAIVDEGDAMTGKRVDVSPAIEPVVLLRGIARARAGRVTTTLFEHTVYPAFGVTTRLGERRYEFFLQCEPQPPVEGQRQDRCDLSLRSESIEQVLASYGTYYEGDNQIFAAEVPPRIVWAGDLNRDGRLDVLLDTSDHYNVREMRLYLSTADASSLVKEVAGYSTSGC